MYFWNILTVLFCILFHFLDNYKYHFKLNDRQNYPHLSWLPPGFPGNVRCIATSADDHLPTTHRLKEHGCYLLNVPPLDACDARQIITTNLQRFGKVICTCIVGKTQSETKYYTYSFILDSVL